MRLAIIPTEAIKLLSIIMTSTLLDDVNDVMFVVTFSLYVVAMFNKVS